MSIQMRRGAQSKRLASTEVLLAGQPFFEKDTNKLYVGDGTTQLKSLNKVEANDSDAAHLTANNTFTGMNTFSNVVSAQQGLISTNSNNLLDNAKLNYNSITRYTDNKGYTLRLPLKTGTLATTDDVVEFSSHKYMINYNCSLTREATMWTVGNSTTGQYGSYTCPGYLVAGYGSGSTSMNDDAVALGPGGLYTYPNGGSKTKYALPKLSSTTNGKIVVADSTNVISDNYTFSGTGNQFTGGLTVSQLSTGTTLQSSAYTITFPSKTCTLASTTGLYQHHLAITCTVKLGTQTTTATGIWYVSILTNKSASMATSSSSTISSNLQALKTSISEQSILRIGSSTYFVRGYAYSSATSYTLYLMPCMLTSSSASITSYTYAHISAVSSIAQATGPRAVSLA